MLSVLLNMFINIPNKIIHSVEKYISQNIKNKQSAYSQMHASAAFILSADAQCGVHMVNYYIKEADSGQQHNCIATF